MAARKSPPETTYPREDRSAEALTIAWMLTALATVVGMLCSLGAYLIVRQLTNPPPSLQTLPGLLLVIAGIGGLLALLLTPLVLRLRKAKPPRSITQAVLFFAALPLFLIAAIEIWG